MKKLFLIILFGTYSSIAVIAQNKELVLERVSQCLVDFSETEDVRLVYAAIRDLSDNQKLFIDGMAEYYTLLIYCYRGINDYSNILKCYQQYERTLTQNSFCNLTYVHRINVLNNVGLAYYSLNMPDKAEEVYLAALNEVKRIEKVSDREHLPVLKEILLGLGVTYAELYNYPKAFFYLKDVINIPKIIRR